MTESTHSLGSGEKKRSSAFRPSLRRLLVLQAAYCLMGIGYNVVSLILSQTGGGPLSPTDPAMGMIVMAAYGASLLVGVLRYVRIYRCVAALSVLVLGYGGVVLHVLNAAAGRLFLYDSAASWALAVAVNLFGLVLNVIGALGLFSEE